MARTHADLTNPFPPLAAPRAEAKPSPPVPSFWSRHRDAIVPFLFVVPAIVYVGAFAFYPTYLTIARSFQTPILSFTTYNYTALAQEGLYTWLGNTLIVTAGALSIQLGVGLLLASILTQQFRGRTAFTTLAILPIGIATVVAAFAFSQILTTQGGYANSVLALFGLAPVDWLSSSSMALLSAIIADSWKNAALVMIILVAGFASIPRSLYQAAAIDGAGPLRRFVYVTLPNLRAYLVIALLIRGAQEFNIFQIAYVMFRANPALLTVQVYVYWSDLSTQYQSAAAASILVGVIALFIVAVVALGGGRR